VNSFFDTNIVVYAQERGEKGNIARALLAEGGYLSVQVLNEFASVSSRKQGRTWPEIEDAVSDILALVKPPLSITIDLNRQARRLASEIGFSFYDALIVAAAIKAGCQTLYSEDMQHGRTVGSVTITNPFRN
jgi:predicted nucleic acid-binding protein